jgi:hypothetical protein
VDSARKTPRRCEQAAALVIVLALVVLVTGLVVAYFSRVTADRQVAHSSFNQGKVDHLAQSAMDNTIGDLRQEITNGSASPAPTFGPASNPGPFTLYVPCVNVGCSTPAPSPGSTACPNSTPTILPVLPIRYPGPTPGTTPAIPNLIRRSVRADAIPCPARASRASAVNSYSDVSANGRSITLARWNSHYFIPKAIPGDDGTEPITTGFNLPNYWAPDWVYVNNNGVTIITQPDNSIIGRYAYMIYDEGGLVDLNAAGYPSPTTILQYGRKGSLAFADLTGLGSYGLSTTAIDNIVGWRNYASSQASGNFSNLTLTPNASTYYNFILSDPNYIRLTSYSPIFFLTSALRAPQNNNQTDQAFITRQALLKSRAAIKAVNSTAFNSNALQYLGTLSREALASVPQWSPTAPDSVNTNFQTLLVTGPFTRNDGTTAYVGDYLVNKRFLLQRLNWLTYKGPSATRNIPTSAPALGSADYDMWLLTRSNGITFGLTRNFLLEGTDVNILKYFGLAWDTTNERWNYVGHGGSTTPIDSVGELGGLTDRREPDFFELLRAGIIRSSLGDSFSSDPALPSVHQQSRMLHLLTIGANVLAQSRADSYPVRIACTVDLDGTPTIMEAVGMPRLPCLSSLAVCPVGVTQNSGGVNWFLIPNLWDPFRDTWDLTEANAGNTGNKPLSTPGYLRPPIRITVSGNIGFGAATASQSGSVDPASVTAFSTTLPGINLSLALATGNSTFGRDGLREAMRLGASDINGSVTSFNPTDSSTGFAWNDIVRPTNDTSTYRTDHFVAFRLSLPGSGVPSGSNGQNPVLILQPGFQVRLEYQSPNGQWYPYSFLQGNNATNTTIGHTDPSNPSNLDLATSFSQYGQPGGYTNPTVVNSGTATLWSDVTGALAHSPILAKADPRSIRYNSIIGVINLTNPPMPVTSAGIIASIWPSPYTAPPPMSPSAYPAPTPTPNPNPATLGDNAPVGNAGNPYNESYGIAENSNPYRPVMMNRPFRSVGEMGYAFRDQPFRTLSFSSTNSPDAGLLDLFTTTAYGPTPSPSPSPSITPTYPAATATPRGGVISLNSSQSPALAAVLTGTITREDSPRNASGASPSPSPATPTLANNTATALVLSTSSAPVVNRADLAALIGPTPNAVPSPSLLDSSVPKIQREAIVRALGEVDQTRTWNLMIDVIAQSGRYPPTVTANPNAADLPKFIVEGEQRYWVHVVIDRFSGEVLDKQIEVVNE